MKASLLHAGDIGRDMWEFALAADIIGLGVYTCEHRSDGFLRTTIDSPSAFEEVAKTRWADVVVPRLAAH